MAVGTFQSQGKEAMKPLIQLGHRYRECSAGTIKNREPKPPISVPGADQSMKSGCDRRLMRATPPFPDDSHKQRVAICLKPRVVVTVPSVASDYLSFRRFFTILCSSATTPLV